MDGNTIVDNAIALNNVIVENSATIISPFANSAAVATVLLAKPFLDISKTKRFLMEKTSEDGKKGFLASLTCMELFGFLLTLRPMTMPKHGHMGIRYKKVKMIWSNMVTKYTAENVGR
ncbi:hypothetical protein POTOM_052732 [Populus tomentosa]|uniref:Uncharacterized protein n=1 Tax=Populus tomentosa TaxID=118781 RepID=A0A8X8C8Z5_POPTO|nr:hypothetical protein POTOM_052732 [Populus tomentosa]